MIRINRQTDYGIRVVIALAKRGWQARASTSEVQREMLIPPALAQRIVAELGHGGFIRTFPGRDGGISLSRPAVQINLRQVVEHFEGPLTISDCLVAAGECPFDNSCPVRCRWARLQATMMRELEQINFAELAQEALAVQNRAARSLAAKKPERRRISAKVSPQTPRN